MPDSEPGPGRVRKLKRFGRGSALPFRVARTLKRRSAAFRRSRFVFLRSSAHWGKSKRFGLTANPMKTPAVAKCFVLKDWTKEVWRWLAPI